MSIITPESSLPRHIDPGKFAQQGVSITGRIPVSNLQRLGSLLAGDAGEVAASLDFTVNEQGIRCLTGAAAAGLEMICQRCLEISRQPVHAVFNLAMVWSEQQVKDLPRCFDPWVVAEGQTDLFQVIEDELILSLPMVPRHDHDCLPTALYSTGGEYDEAGNCPGNSSIGGRSKPFQVLQQLRASSGNDRPAVAVTETDKSGKDR